MDLDLRRLLAANRHVENTCARAVHVAERALVDLLEKRVGLIVDYEI